MLLKVQRLWDHFGCDVLLKALTVAARASLSGGGIVSERTRSVGTGVPLTYTQLRLQRFLGELQQLRPVDVVGPEFVH